MLQRAENEIGSDERRNEAQQGSGDQLEWEERPGGSKMRRRSGGEVGDIIRRGGNIAKKYI